MVSSQFPSGNDHIEIKGEIEPEQLDKGEKASPDRFFAHGEITPEQLDKGEIRQSAGSEAILGRIDDASSVGEYCSLFFTNTRMIKAITESLVESIWGNMPIRELQRRERELSVMTPDAILQANRSNSYIPYADVKSVMIKNGGIFNDTFLLMVVGDKKYKFKFPRQKFDESLKVVNQVMPGKVTVG